MSYDRIRDEVLEAIVKGSKCLPHEGRAMARELQEFRAAQPKQVEAESWSPYSIVFPNIP